MYRYIRKRLNQQDAGDFLGVTRALLGLDDEMWGTFPGGKLLCKAHEYRTSEKYSYSMVMFMFYVCYMVYVCYHVCNTS